MFDNCKVFILRFLLSLTFLFLFSFNNLFAQKKIPVIQNYDKADYQAGRQNWDVDIAPNGIVYFANTDGLLCNIYGEWKLYQTPKKQPLRVILAEKDTVWCGGTEFGFFVKTQDSMIFHDLGTLKGRQAWHIATTEKNVVFQTSNEIIIYDKVNRSISRTFSQTQIWSVLSWKSKVWYALENG